MAKKIRTVLTLQLPAGKATPAPPVGTALGPHGINIVEFTKTYNERTAAQSGQIIPAKITIFEDRSFTFILKTPPAADLLRKAAGRREGLRRRRSRGRGGQRDPGPAARDRRDQEDRPQRRRSRRWPRASSPARLARWASRSPTSSTIRRRPPAGADATRRGQRRSTGTSTPRHQGEATNGRSERNQPHGQARKAIPGRRQARRARQGL